MNQKSHVAPYFDHLYLRNAVVWLPMPLASHDADSGTSDVTWQKGHVTPHFDHLDIRNAVVPFMTQHCVMLIPVSIVSHDQNSNIVPHFNHFDPVNVMMQLMMPWALYDANASTNGITWQKRDAAPHFSCLDLTNWVEPFIIPFTSRDVRLVPVASQDYKSCQVAPHLLFLILIILTNQRQWWDWRCLWHPVMLISGPLMSHDWKTHIVPHFNHLTLTNRMVQLTV